jgi:peptide/nickel transport system ATP-binding protein
MSQLEIENLAIGFKIDRSSAINVVDGIDLVLQTGDTLAVIGESGCGKSLIAMALLGILPHDAQVQGKILLDGLDLTEADPKTMRTIRRTRFGYVPQSSGTCLNPVLRIGTQAREILHTAADPVAVDVLLQRVGLKPAVGAMYPHQISEGMKSRAMVGLGTCRDPDVLIADEPTRGLDRQSNAGVLALLRDLVKRANRTLFIITHDLDVVSALQGRLAVMYAGQFVEVGPARAILESHCSHPYTDGLLQSHPGNGMHPLPGKPPGVYERPAGCRFANRCVRAESRCGALPPPIRPVGAGHWVRCFHA